MSLRRERKERCKKCSRSRSRTVYISAYSRQTFRGVTRSRSRTVYISAYSRQTFSGVTRSRSRKVYISAYSRQTFRGVTRSRSRTVYISAYSRQTFTGLLGVEAGRFMYQHTPGRHSGDQEQKKDGLYIKILQVDVQGVTRSRSRTVYISAYSRQIFRGVTRSRSWTVYISANSRHSHYLEYIQNRFYISMTLGRD